jgi:hypothetical protein
VKSLTPLLVAGSTFAVTFLLGVFAGVLVADRTGQWIWAFAGSMAGVGIGGYSAVRLLMRSLQ